MVRARCVRGACAVRARLGHVDVDRPLEVAARGSAMWVRMQWAIKQTNDGDSALRLRPSALHSNQWHGVRPPCPPSLGSAAGSIQPGEQKLRRAQTNSDTQESEEMEALNFGAMVIDDQTVSSLSLLVEL